MSSEWRLTTVEAIAAPRPAAMATGPFGSSISAKYFVPSGVPVIRGGNLSADVSIRLNDDGLVFVSEEKASEFQRSIAVRGDLVFTCWGTINQVGLVDASSRHARYVVSNKQMKLSVDSTKVDSLFLYYLFSGPEKQAEILDNGIGSSVPGFNLGQLKQHGLLLPPVSDQKRIAAALGALDDRIALLRETNATLEAIAQALFKSWFVDFDPVRAKQQGLAPVGMDEATAALFPDSFEDSLLGLVPTAWQATNIGAIADVIDCLHSKKPDLVDDGHPFLQLNSIRDDGLLDTSKVGLISEADYAKWISRIEAREGDCVVTNVGRVGAVAQIPAGFRAAIGRNMTAIRARDPAGTRASPTRCRGS